MESVPSTFIMTAIWAKFKLGGSKCENMKTIFSVNSCLVIFVSVENNGVFLTTYAISIISATLGLAKCLKNGVARPIAPGGTLDGFLTGKFVVAFLASAVSLMARGLCIAFTPVNYKPFRVRER